MAGALARVNLFPKHQIGKNLKSAEHIFHRKFQNVLDFFCVAAKKKEFAIT